MELKLLKYDDVSKQAWDQLVFASDEGWLYQTTAWIDYAHKWGSYSHSFALASDKEQLLAVCPIYTDQNSKGFVKRLYTGYSGPALHPSLVNKSKKKVWKSIFKYMDDVGLQLGADMLQVRVTNLAPRYLSPMRREVNPLWSVGLYEPLSAIPHETLVLDLSKPEEVLMSEMDEDCRAAIRQAVRAGLTCRMGESIQDAELYYELHRESWSRTGLKPHALEYFTDMWTQLGGATKFFFAELNGKAVAGILVHVYKNGAFYWGGCSKLEVLKLRPNNFLLWSVIKSVKLQDCCWFEVGQFPSFPGKDEKGYNVGRYKAQFGSNTFIPFEGQKFYSRKGKIYNYLKRFRESD